MRRLVSIKQLIDNAESEGTDPNTIFVDPEDTCALDPDELDELLEVEE